MQNDSSLLARLLANNQFSLASGELLIYNIPSMIFPINTLLFANQILSLENEKRFMTMCYLLGKDQSQTGGSIMYDQLGFKKNRQSAELGNQQGEFVGIGRQEYVKFDLEKKQFTVKIMNNPLAKQHAKVFGHSSKPIDHFVRGLVCGANCAVSDAELFCVETQCIAQGKPCCVFEVKPLSDFDLKDPLVKSQLLDESLDIKGTSTNVNTWRK